MLEMTLNIPTKGMLCVDIDGVLIDELPCENDWRTAFSPLARKLYQQLCDDVRWQSCLRGEVRVRDILPLLGTVEGSPQLHQQLLQLWHGRSVVLNTGLIQIIKEMKGRGWRIAIASNQDIDRAEILRRSLSLEETVDIWGFSCHLGAAKPTKAFYQALLGKFGASNLPCVMIDDIAENLEIPQQMGWKTHHYRGLSAFKIAMESF